MSDNFVGQTPAVYSSKERAALVAQALGEAARRARFSTKRRRTFAIGSLRERRSALTLRLLKISTFIGIVALPCLAFAYYIFAIASPQFAAESRFTVRGGMPSSIKEMGRLGGAPSMLIIQDTQVILNYLQSRGIVEELKKRVDYESLYQKTSIDWLSRLKSNQPIEDVLRYWKRHETVSVQMPSGIVTLSIRAFDPQEAVTVSNAVLATADALINDMNEKMRQDAVALAETERQRAESNLAKTRANLERARNEEGMLSASEESKGLTQLIETVEGQRLKLQQEYDSQRRFVRDDAPQLKNIKAKIDASQKEVAALRAQMTQSSAQSAAGQKTALSGSMSRLDFATLQNSIAEKIYAVSLAALEQAHLASESKLMYINTFVTPSLPQQAEYPKRALDMLIFAAATLGLWLVVLGLLALARNALLS